MDRRATFGATPDPSPQGEGTRAPFTKNQRAGPVSTGRVGSAPHSDQEPS